MKKRGQAWGFDLMIAVTIFAVGIIIFYVYSINYPEEGRETLDKLYYEGNLIADSILSEGFPESWNSDNVIRIGILSNNKVNETKLEGIYNLTTETPGGYFRTQGLFNTKYNYFFNFSEQIILDRDPPLPIPGIGQQATNPTNLIKITRFTSYQNKPVILDIYIWE